MGKERGRRLLVPLKCPWPRDLGGATVIHPMAKLVIRSWCQGRDRLAKKGRAGLCQNLDALGCWPPKAFNSVTCPDARISRIMAGAVVARSTKWPGFWFRWAGRVIGRANPQRPA